MKCFQPATTRPTCLIIHKLKKKIISWNWSIVYSVYKINQFLQLINNQFLIQNIKSPHWNPIITSTVYYIYFVFSLHLQPLLLPPSFMVHTLGMREEGNISTKPGSMIIFAWPKCHFNSLNLDFIISVLKVLFFLTLLPLFNFHLQLFLKKNKKITYSFCVNFVHVWA